MNEQARLIESKRAQELREAAGRVTERTLAFLSEMGKVDPYAVYPIVVHFDPVTSSNLSVLMPSGDLQADRAAQYAEACRHAERVQGSVRDFLTTSSEARDCFSGNPVFCFEPGRHARPLPLTNTLLVLANHKLAEAIRQRENVLAIQRDLEFICLAREEPRPYRLRVRRIPRNPGGHSVDGYTWGWRRLGVPVQHQQGIRGKGVVIGLIDTGALEEHSDLKFKIKDFAIVGPPAGHLTPAHSFDYYGHGTFCAGIIVGAANSGVQIGGAPDADLKVAAICDPNGWWTSFLSASEWLTDPYRNARVVNVSMGVRKISPEDAQLCDRVFRTLLGYKTAFVAAAGNVAGQESYPARLITVLGAGAFDPDGERSTFSGIAPDLLLPGSDVFSCVPAGLVEFGGYSYGYCDGTSFAAPHLTALIALLMQAFPKSPPWRIVKALKQTAMHKVVRDEREWGRGVPDLQSAIDYLENNVNDN